ncbi:MAG: hypothetical protein A2297_07385 [Elusimicrobia bacterium RIFOXYB2_FULL_48_7]|nr:MAG: hypothetical protein A2297_07385 [Elusimicrobia bacterium RIFOXYB2_FULL_48_7]
MKKYALIFYFVIYTAVNLFYLDKYPLIWWDDAHSTELSWSLIQYGDFSSRLCNPYFGFEKLHAVYGRFYTIANAAVIYILGLGPFQARLFPFLTGLLLLFLVFKVTKHYFDENTGVFASIFLSLSYLFILHSHLARPDITVAAFIMLAIYLFTLGLEKNSVPVLLLSGFVSGLAIDIHPPGVTAVFGLIGLALLNVRKLKFKGSLALAAGAALGGVWWICWHILPDSQTFFYQWKNYWLWEKPPISEDNVFIMIRNEFNRYYTFFWEGRFHRNMALAAIFLVSILHALWKRSPGQKAVLSVISGMLFCFIFVVPSKTDFYLIFIFPLFIILVSDSIKTFIGSRRIPVKLAGIAMLSAAALLIAAEDAYILAKFRHADYYGFTAKLKKYIPDTKEPILGQPVYWFAFIKDRPYFTDYFGYYLYYDPKEGKIKASHTFAEVVKKNKIRYLIVDDGFFFWNRDNNHKDVFPFIENNCTLAGTIEDKYFGPGYYAFLKQENCITKIYRVD